MVNTVWPDNSLRADTNTVSVLTHIGEVTEYLEYFSHFIIWDIPAEPLLETLGTFRNFKINIFCALFYIPTP